MQNFMKTILSAFKTWTQKKIKDSTADWNENDSSKSSYVKNRTHWEEKKTKVLVDNLTDNECSNGNAPQCNFVPGNKYTVIWNGIEYADLVCYSDGNCNIIGGQDKFPFYIDDDGGNGLYIEAEDVPYTVSIIEDGIKVHKLDKKYLDLPDNIATTDGVEEALEMATAGKMDKFNPVGNGSFSMNRKLDSEIGQLSIALGESTIANTDNSLAAGRYNVEIPTEIIEEWVSETRYHEKTQTVYIAQGYIFDELTNQFQLTGKIEEYPISACNIAWGGDIARYGMIDTDIGTELFKVINGARAMLDRRSGKYFINKAFWMYQSIRGKYTLAVGNGISDTERSNAHTLDWNGVGWFQGGLQVGGTVQDGEGVGYVPAVAGPMQVGQILSVKAIDENGKPTEWEVVDPWVITSSTEGSSKKFKISIDDTGTLIVAEEVE